ncbi:hypothetical protein ACEU2D_24655 [Brevibacillus laterosporus]|uniref:hypothetical protein n=1 Tax=Brevibacillus laterosporus TaxID=1465 RepID=UPI0035A5A422
MKKMIAISFLSLAVVGLSFFPTNIQASGIPWTTSPGIDPTKGYSGGGGSSGGLQCHSFDC